MAASAVPDVVGAEPVAEDCASDVESPDPAVAGSVADSVADSVWEPVTIGMMGTSVLLSVELLEATEEGSSVGKVEDVVCSTAVPELLVVDAAELPVPTMLSDTPVDIGTGTAVVPSVPVDVLRL